MLGLGVCSQPYYCMYCCEMHVELVLPVLCFPIFDVQHYRAKKKKRKKKKRVGFFFFKKQKKKRTKISLSTSESVLLTSSFGFSTENGEGGAAVHPVGMDPPPPRVFRQKG